MTWTTARTTTKEAAIAAPHDARRPSPTVDADPGPHRRRRDAAVRRARLPGDHDRGHRRRRRASPCRPSTTSSGRSETSWRPSSTRRSPATPNRCRSSSGRGSSGSPPRRTPRRPSTCSSRARSGSSPGPRRSTRSSAGRPPTPRSARCSTRNRRDRRADQRRLVEMLAEAGHLRAGLDVDTAADVFYAVVNEEVFQLLVVDCGWDVDRFGSWLTARCCPTSSSPAEARRLDRRPAGAEVGEHGEDAAVGIRATAAGRACRRCWRRASRPRRR